VGAGRCGVAPGPEAVALARRVADAPGLRFAGLQAYQGRAQHLRTPTEREAAIAAASRHVRDTLEGLEAAGLSCPTVAGAGTGTFRLEMASGLWNELQAGSYVFMDADYRRNLDAGGRPVEEFRQALHLWAGVISRPGRGRAVLDVGLKSVSVDSGLPLLADHPDWEAVGVSDEHLVVRIPDGARGPAVGERLRLVPGHCDPTVNLHDWYVAVRGNRVEALWPIVARGAIW
jgi:3-hydroxy-D-aspartate aldolase